LEARRAVECHGSPIVGGAVDYVSDGLNEVAADPREAMKRADDGPVHPPGRYSLERQAGDRVLLTWRAGATTKIAAVLHDGVRDYRGAVGWGIESWAQCDVSEFGEATAASLGYALWRDRSNTPVPVTKLFTHPNERFCDYPGVTGLELGVGESSTAYIHDPDHQLTEYVTVRYLDDTELPAAATDTGWHRNGRELWRSASSEAVYLVSLDDPADVQRWPRFTAGCG